MSIQIGDRVAYSAAFLRCTGQQTGDSGQGRGKVIAIKPLGGTQLAEIEWEGNHDLPSKVNVANLAKVGANSKFCQC